jgi:non-canonical poly(A) RNA polymerase PAPD5/7
MPTRQNQNRMDKWTIIDPNKSDNDISGGSSKAPLIAKKFSEAHEALRSRMAFLNRASNELRKGQSLLGEVFGGNYSSFVDQRNRMQTLYDQNYRSR